MTVILLEALAALALFVGAIWWTMFSGRDKGELRRKDDAEDDTPARAAEPADPGSESQRRADDEAS